MKPALSRDTLALVISQAFFNGALAIEVMWLGRWLDRGDLGLYFYALSLGSLLEAGVHWGAQHYLARQAAIAPGKLRRELSLLATGMVCFLSLSGAVLGLAVDLYLALIATAVMMRAGAGALSAVFVGRRRVGPPIVGRLLAQILLLSGLWLAVRPQAGLAVLSPLLFAVAAVYMLVLVAALSRLALPRERDTGSADGPASWRHLGGRLWPFLLLFFLGQGLYRADAALLKWTAGVDAVSTMLLAFKWVEGLFFAPAVVASVAIPYLLEAHSRGRLGVLLPRYVAVLLVGLCGASLLLLLAGAPFLDWVLGDRFVASRPYYDLLVWALPLQGLGFFFSTVLVAFGHERLLLLVTAATAGGGLLAKVVALHLWDLHGYATVLLAVLLAHALATGVALRVRLRTGP